ncbi:transmembrane protein 51a [Anguilla anguilla]|uniref:transmembrane protein 51a n=1 Tax=Anguilla anguilla TaxID=7936 RepID=UPI0015AE001E|nr:transmembrane protein 51a [Anguilla anguilla]
MCSSGQLCSGNGRPPSSYASDNANNSGSQYALCALGVGLVALGIVMIVWSVVPSNVPGNSSSGGSGGGSKPGPGNANASARGNTSSVAFVLAGVGVAMLLLSICLGVRSKRRQQRAAQAADARLSTRATQGQEGETEETAARYDVPTYEEAVGSGRYPAPPSLLPCSSSASQLPSYEDLVDGVQHEDEDEAPAGPQPTPAAAAAAAPQLQPAPNRQNGLGRKLRPPKVRRIKSEKLHLKDISNAPQAGPPSIEPLTPPPQYDDQLPRL